MLPCHAPCVRARLCYNGHSLLLNSLYLELIELKILHAASAVIRLRTFLISFCTVNLRLQRLFCIPPSVQVFGSCPASVAPLSAAMLPSLRTGLLTTPPTYHAVTLFAARLLASRRWTLRVEKSFSSPLLVRK